MSTALSSPRLMTLLLAATLCACASKPATSPPKPPQAEAADKAPGEPATTSLGSGIDLAGFDRSVRPQDDFYAHVNGTWLERTELPADRSDYGSFSVLSDEAEAQLLAIIKEVSSSSKDLKAGSAEQQIRDYYNAYVKATDSERVELGDLKQNEFALIDAIATRVDFYLALGELARVGINGPLSAGIASDMRDPEAMTVYLSQARLTLPDRDYYLKDEPRYVKARALYVTYLEELMPMAGYAPRAEEILAFETALAEITWTREALREPTTQYNPHSISELKGLSAALPWEGYVEALGVPKRERYIVMQPSFVAALDSVIAKTDLETLKSYLRSKVLSSYASVLGRPAFEANYRFFDKGLRGVEEPRPSWKRAIATMNGSMGEVLGQIYVSRHFKPEAKRRMGELVEQLTATYAESIDELDWMSEATKERALEKLATFNPKVGYPDVWRDYSELEIKQDAVSNARALEAFEFARDRAKLDRPVDKTEWAMPPQRVNAYYNPLWNEIVFPAAILQPPFFNLEAEDAVNYGAIGAVIGHEIGHGFDDKGRKFDSLGAMNDWWTAQDAEEFERRKEALSRQYDAFEVIDGERINGEFTSGENIGDLAGLSIAYKAYRRSLRGEPAPVIDGLTGDQRFFMGWAQVWRRLYTEEELKRRLVSDPHSPSKARVNVVVRNLPAFYSAFEVEPGDAMYLPPEERVSIW